MKYYHSFIKLYQISISLGVIPGFVYGVTSNMKYVDINLKKLKKYYNNNIKIESVIASFLMTFYGIRGVFYTTLIITIFPISIPIIFYKYYSSLKNEEQL